MIQTSGFQRGFSFPLNLFSHSCVDFVIHDSKRYRNVNSTILDALWSGSMGSNLFLFWLVSKKDSHFLIRQLAASTVNFSQLVASFTYTLCDVCLSSIIDKINPNSEVFSKKALTKRGITRMINVLRRNGGVYSDISDMIINFLGTTRLFPEFQILNEMDFAESDEDYIKTSYDDLKKTFRKEFGNEIEEVFKDIDIKPSEDGTFSIFNGKMKNGLDVSITFMNPIKERMRKLDMIPFKLFGCIFNLIPGLKLEKQIYNTFIKRLDYSIQMEVNSRLTILEKYGVNTSDDNPKALFRKSRKISLPIYLPAPIKSLCSEHIMTSDIQPCKFQKVTSKDTKTLVNLTSKLLFGKNCIIGDLSQNNLRKFNNRLSLNKFSSLTEIDNESLSAGVSLAWSYYFKNKIKGVKSGSILGLPEDLTLNMIREQKVNPSLIREVIAKNHKLLLPLGEATSGLINSGIDSKAGKCAYAPLAAGFMSKISSPSNTSSTFPYSIGNVIQILPF